MDGHFVMASRRTFEIFFFESLAVVKVKERGVNGVSHGLVIRVVVRLLHMVSRKKIEKEIQTSK